MDKLCLLLGWGVMRSGLFLLEDLNDDYTFKFFLTLNGLTVFLHTFDAVLYSLDNEVRARVPEEILLGLSFAGGSPGACLALVLVQNARRNQHSKMAHMIICATQGLLLMSLIQYRHCYSIEDQISEAADEVQFTLDMVWQNLMSRFSWNSRKHRTATGMLFNHFSEYLR